MLWVPFMLCKHRDHILGLIHTIRTEQILGGLIVDIPFIRGEKRGEGGWQRRRRRTRRRRRGRRDLV